MKICYDSPMTELKELLQIISDKQAVTISVTKSEMASIVKHAEARTLFPAYFNRIDIRKAQIKSKLTEITKRLSDPRITGDEQQACWDEQTRYEKQIRNIEDDVPNEIRTESNIIVRVSMLA